jgi:hypothetical protein
MSDVFTAPTVSNTTVVSVTNSASAQQVAPGGKQTVYVVSSTACYVIFGQVGSVPTPSSSNAVPLAAGVFYKFQTSNGANAFKVIRQSADGTLTWTVG